MFPPPQQTRRAISLKCKPRIHVFTWWRTKSLASDEIGARKRSDTHCCTRLTERRHTTFICVCVTEGVGGSVGPDYRFWISRTTFHFCPNITSSRKGVHNFVRCRRQATGHTCHLSRSTPQKLGGGTPWILRFVFCSCSSGPGRRRPCGKRLEVVLKSS